jgi:hypothetical protein
MGVFQPKIVLTNFFLSQIADKMSPKTTYLKFTLEQNTYFLDLLTLTNMIFHRDKVLPVNYGHNRFVKSTPGTSGYTTWAASAWAGLRGVLGRVTREWSARRPGRTKRSPTCSPAASTGYPLSRPNPTTSIYNAGVVNFYKTPRVA